MHCFNLLYTHDVRILLPEFPERLAIEKGKAELAHNMRKRAERPVYLTSKRLAELAAQIRPHNALGQSLALCPRCGCRYPGDLGHGPACRGH